MENKRRRNVRPELRLLESFLIVVAGASCLLATIVFPFDPNYAMLSFFTSIGLVGVGLVDLLYGMKHISKLERLNILGKLRSDHSGIISIWIVCFISLIVYSILWFTLGWATFSIMDSVEASFSFPAQALPTIAAMRLVLTWHPLLFFFGMLLWAYNLSQKTEEITQPIGFM
jgi:hypothetical protein